MGSKWRELMKERMVDMTLDEFKEAVESVTDVVKDLHVLRTENAQLKERVEFLEKVLLAMASKD
jgi:cell shape-determining protein MreC